MIPRVNIPDMMLDDEVVQAVERGEFNVWVVETIDEGLEVLTGMDPAGIAERVAATLERFRQQAG